MPPKIDHTGRRFGRLVVIRPTSQRCGGAIVWECRCDCGNLTPVRSLHLTNGNTRSCGCIQREYAKSGTAHLIDGRSRLIEYRAYMAARGRCTQKRLAGWKHYGGRGIRFCFSSFKEFFAHLGPKPKPELTLDRINNDGNYEPGNVRWATKSEQAFNRRLRTHCRNGHAFTPENTSYVKPTGATKYRTCRQCSRNHDRKRLNIPPKRWRKRETYC